MPESARWLKINGRHEEATNLIKYISKKNGKPLSEKLLAKIKHNSNEDAEEVRNDRLYPHFNQFDLVDGFREYECCLNRIYRQNIKYG